MSNSFTAELLKLRKRRAVWGLCAALALVVALFGYGIVYFVIVNRSSNVQITGDVAELRRSLLPEHFASFALSFLSSRLGGAVALVLGALATGSEYGWGTLKTVFPRAPSRLRAFAGKLSALAVILLALVLLCFAAAAVSSIVVASAEDAAVRWPPIWELVRALGTAWVVLVVWAALGVLLATLLRGTGLAIGLGLVYVLLVESVIGQLAGLSEVLRSLQDALPGVNAGRLAGALREGSENAAGPATVLVAYTLGFLVLASALVRQRDVV